MTRSLSSAPTPQYGAPALPITTTRRTPVDIARDEVSSKNTLPPEETERLIGKISGRPAALEIPTFDRGWHPNEITRWLDDVENDESVSDEDLARARQAVSEALGVDA